jgi:hypothetical protein
MPKRKVLYVCHNHPSVYPGGAETYALELYEAMRASDEFEPIFLARTGSIMPHLGTPFSATNADGNQYFFYADGSGFDWLYGTSRNKDLGSCVVRERRPV